VWDVNDFSGFMLTSSPWVLAMRVGGLGRQAAAESNMGIDCGKINSERRPARRPVVQGRADGPSVAVVGSSRWYQSPVD